MKRREFLAATLALPQAGFAQSRRNVLLICVDDLRPWLGCYGEKWMVTPNIDGLAKEGRVFTRHYVQSAACGPSRCTMLTGRTWNNWDCWAETRKLTSEPAEPVSIAHLLRRSGYETVSIGKVSHQPSGTMDNEQRVHQVPFSWDRAYTPVGAWKTPWRAFFGYAGGEAYNTQSLPPAERDKPRLPMEFADVPDTGYPDGLTADAAVGELEKLSKSSKPFFLAAGFFKPHLPFTAPKKYWDLYPKGVPPGPSFGPAENTDPKISVHPSGELTGNHYWPAGRGVISDEDRKRLRHAYAACVSYSDAQVGKVLKAVDRLGLRDSTMVVLWADHGWHLGEHGLFGKGTNHEFAVRSPLIIRTPKQSKPGASSNALAESLDLYPTIAEYCGVRAPSGLQGTSLMPALKDASAPGKERAFSFFPRGKLMGRTVRSDKWRLVVWTDAEGGIVQRELYDHTVDPNETVNRAEQSPDVVATLMKDLPPVSVIRQ